MTPTTTTTQVRLWQKLVAGLCSLVATYSLLLLAPTEQWKIGIALFALAAAAFIVHLPALGPQLVVRAVWWANLGLGTAFCVFQTSGDGKKGLALALSCGAALLVIGRRGIAEASERASYAPAAFRSSLLLLMALALADAQTFLLFAVVLMTGSSNDLVPGLVLALAGVAFLVGFAGLYRLWLWGALLNVLTAVTFGIIVLTKIVHFDSDIAKVFLTLCGLQLLAATPMLIGLVRRKPLPSAPAALRGAAATIVVAGVMLLCVVLVTTR